MNIHLVKISRILRWYHHPTKLVTVMNKMAAMANDVQYSMHERISLYTISSPPGCGVPPGGYPLESQTSTRDGRDSLAAFLIISAEFVDMMIGGRCLGSSNQWFTVR